MARVMAGESGLTFSQLSKVASYFGRGTLFFLEPGPLRLGRSLPTRRPQ